MSKTKLLRNIKTIVIESHIWVNYTVLSSRLEICSLSIATRGSRRAAPKAGKVTYVTDTRFPTALRILGSRLYIFVLLPLTLDNRCCLKWEEAGAFPQTTPSDNN